MAPPFNLIPPKGLPSPDWEFIDAFLFVIEKILFDNWISPNFFEMILVSPEKY